MDNLGPIFETAGLICPSTYDFKMILKIRNYQKTICFCCSEGSQLMVNCWFGARWFGFLESPYEKDWDSWVYPDSNPKPPGPKPTSNH